MRTFLLISATVFACAGEPSPPPADPIVNDGGQITLRPYPIEERFLNQLPPAEEAAYQHRVNECLASYRDAFKGKYGNAYFENEKQSYPNAFIDRVNGERKASLGFLQADDNEGWNAKTLKVDWFPGFTIRSQTRKYFYFGGLLDPAYRKKMYDAARIWTEKDPLRRPNDAFVPPGQREARKMAKDGGWTPEYMNSWVDVRNTDNLRAMREGAVYLMAEETGNTEVAKIYADRIRAYANACYSTGMGEWDSANYLAHTIVGYLQIYDFAKDPEVKSLAKGVLDYLSTVAAVAYFKGAVCAPNARDYNNVGPKQGFAGEAWLWFGENDAPESGKPYRDFIHMATSAYRPPAAVMAVARKDFAKPVEILQAKPTYDAWFLKPGGEDRVEYPVFLHVGNSYQIGTLPFLHRGDVNGFRLGMIESGRGVATVIAFSGTKGYKGHATATNGKDQVAQLRNCMLWMNQAPGADLHLTVPRKAAVEQSDGWTFVRGERTWLALKAIQADGGGVDEALTTDLFAKKDKKTGAVTGSTYPDDTILTWKGTDAGPCGVFLEVGEAESHGDYAAFVAGVKKTARIDLGRLAVDKRVSVISSKGESLAMTLTEAGRPAIERDGKPYDWATHTALYDGGSIGTSPVTLGWKQGVLEVKAGGRSFTGTMKNGRYTWENR